MTAANVRTMREICFLMMSISYRLLCGSWLRKVGIGDDRRGDGIRAAVPLQQSLMRRRKEREPREEILIVRFHAPGQTCAGVAGDDQRNQNSIDIDLVLIGTGAAAEAPPIGELGIDRGVERNDVASGTVGNRNWTT